MLIVCPSCATSYMIDTASLGEAGRMVRCARCRATWYAGGPEAERQVSTFVDEVIAEAEADSKPPPFLRAPAGEPSPPPTVHFGDQPATENFGTLPVEQDFGAPQQQPTAQAAPGVASPSGVAPESAPDATPAAARRAAPEPEAVEDAPSLVPPEPADIAEREHESDDVETFAARRQRLKSRRKQAKRSSRWTAAILVLIAFNVALIGGRTEVVRWFPQTASLFAAIGLPVNLQHLKFENVQIVPSGEGLAVEGTIVSTASQSIKVPDLRFAARNAAGQEIYTWTVAPTRQMLDPGAKLKFRTELASPPADARDVLVRFLTAEEAAAMKASGMKPGAKAPGAMTPGPAHGNR